MNSLLNEYEKILQTTANLFKDPNPKLPQSDNIPAFNHVAAALASVPCFEALPAPRRYPASEATAPFALELARPKELPVAGRQHEKWRLKRVVVGHKGWVRCLAIDPANDFFASGSVDCTVKCWDLASNTLRLTLTGHVAAVRCLEFTPQHVYLLSAGEDKQVRCWDLNTNQTVRNYHGHLSAVNCLSAHPLHSVFVSGGRDGAVRLWDLRTREQLRLFEGHKDAVTAVAMQAKEPQLVSASADATVRIWDILSGRRYAVLTEHKKGVRDLVLHSNGDCLFSVAADNCKQYKLPKGNFIQNVERGKGEISNCAALNGDDVLVVGSNEGVLTFYDWESGRIFQSLRTPSMPGSLEAENSIFDVAFDASGSRLLTAECDKTIKVYEQIN